MFPVNITITNIADLRKILSVLEPEGAAASTATSEAKAAAKKSVPAGAPARSQPTATAGTAPAAQKQSTGTPAHQSDTAPGVDASSATEVTYADLAKSVGELMKKVSTTEAVQVAKDMGYANFKALPVDKYAEAKANVDKLIASLGEGGVV